MATNPDNQETQNTAIDPLKVNTEGLPVLTSKTSEGYIENPLAMSVARLQNETGGNAQQAILKKAMTFLGAAENTNTQQEIEKQKVADENGLDRDIVEKLSQDVYLELSRKGYNANHVMNMRPELIEFLAENPYHARVVKDDLAGANALVMLGEGASAAGKAIELTGRRNELAMKWSDGTATEQELAELDSVADELTKLDGRGGILYDSSKFILQSAGQFGVDWGKAELLAAPITISARATATVAPAPQIKAAMATIEAGARMLSMSSVQSKNAYAEAYYRFRKDGLSHDKAQNAARYIGGIAGVVSFLPTHTVIEAAAAPVEKQLIAKAAVDKLVATETFKKAQATVVANYFKAVAAEGAEEAVQQLSNDIVEIAAKADAEIEWDAPDFVQVLGRAGNAGLMGSLGSLLPIGVLTTVAQGGTLRKLSKYSQQQIADAKEQAAIDQNPHVKNGIPEAGRLYQGKNNKTWHIDSDGIKKAYGDSAQSIAEALGVGEAFRAAGDSNVRLEVTGEKYVNNWNSIIKGKLDAYSTRSPDGLTQAQGKASELIAAELEAKQAEADKAKERTASRRMIEQKVKEELGKAGESSGRASMAAKIVSHVWDEIADTDADLYKEYTNKPLFGKRRKVLLNPEGEIQRGAIDITDKNATVLLTDASDGTTAMHEIGHYLMDVLEGADLSKKPELAKALEDAKALIGTNGKLDTNSQEKLANAFESWLASGMSPKDALNPIFSVYRKVFANVYGDQQTMQSSPLTYLFAKMMGGTDMIAEAEKELGLPDVEQDIEGDKKKPTAENVGMNKRQMTKEQGELIKRVYNKLMRGKVKDLRSLEKMAREDAIKWAKEADFTRALKYLKTGKLAIKSDEGSIIDVAADVDGGRKGKPKIDIDELKSLLASGQISQAAFNRLKPYAAGWDDGAIPLQDFARLFAREGNPVQFLKEIDQAHDIERVVAAKAAEYAADAGLNTFIDEEALLSEAMQVVLSNPTYQKIAGEIAALNKLAGVTGGTDIDIIRAQAKNKASRYPYKKTSVRKVENSVRSLAKEVNRYLANKNWSKAAERKKAYLEQLMLKEELEAEFKRTAKEVEYIKKFTAAKSGKLANIALGNIDLANAAESLLEMFSTERKSMADVRGARISIRRWKQLAGQLDGQGMPIEIPEEVLQSAGTLYIDEANLSTIHAVHDALKLIDGLAKKERNEKQLLAEAKQAGLKSQAIESLRTNYAKRFKDFEAGKLKLEQSGVATDALTKLRAAGTDTLNHFKIIEFVFREMDDFKNDGWWTNNVFRPMAEAFDKAQLEIQTANAKIGKAIQKLGINGLKRNIYVKELGATLTSEQLMAIALNYGNAENAKTLFDANPYGKRKDGTPLLNDETIIPILNNLTAKEIAAVNTIFEVMNQDSDRVFNFHKERTGESLDMVKPWDKPVKLNNGKITGGYYRIKYETGGFKEDFAVLDDDALGVMTGDSPAKSPMSGLGTNKGFTYERSGAPEGASLRLDLGVVNFAINERYVALNMTDPSRSVARILTSPEVARSMDIALGDGTNKMAVEWLKRTIGRVRGLYNDQLSQNVRTLARNVTLSAIAFKPITALVNVSGLLPAFNEIGAVRGVEAIGRFISSPITGKQMTQEAVAKSAFMATRVDNLARDQAEALHATRNNPLASAYANTGMWMTRGIQLGVDVSVFHAAYNKAIYEGESEADAVYAAEAAVRTSQSTALRYGTSDFIGTNNPFVKLISVLAGWSNMMLNRGRYEVKKLQKRGVVQLPGFIVGMFNLYVMTSIVESLLRGRLSDDEEKNKEAIGGAMLNNIAGQIPFGGLLSERGPLPVSMLGSITRDGAKVYEAIANDEDWNGYVMARLAANVGGVAVGLPASQITTTLKAVERADNGEEVNPLDYLRVPPRQ